MEFVVCVGKKFGIDTVDGIPWYQVFQEKIQKISDIAGIMIMDMKTFDYIGKSPVHDHRLTTVVVTEQPIRSVNKNLMFLSIDECFKYVKDSVYTTTPVYVIGGNNMYRLFNKHVKVIHMTEVRHDQSYNFSNYFDNVDASFQIVDTTGPHKFEYASLKGGCGWTYWDIIYMKKEEGYDDGMSHDKTYLTMCKKVLHEGHERTDRTGTGTISIFGEQMKFDIRTSIPILTSKRIPWKSCIEELLWFLRGDTDANILSDKGVKIWNSNSSRSFLDDVGLSHLKEGDCGANYSFQWRHFGAEYTQADTNYQGNGVDQIQMIEDLLKTDPYSRRIFMSAWNPCDLKKTVLPPCHVSAQFYVDHLNLLHCHMYQRSCDMFLGVPWNILSYSVLTYILAKRHGYKPGTLTMSLGDAHVYKDHVKQMHTQLQRQPLCAPQLFISDDVIHKRWDDVCIDDFEVVGYFYHPSIYGKMSA
jgi:thymidylate synthase